MIPDSIGQKPTKMPKQTKRAIKFKKQGGLKTVMQKRKVKKQSAKKFNKDKDEDAKPKGTVNRCCIYMGRWMHHNRCDVSAAKVVDTKSSYQEMNVDDFMDGGFLDVESGDEEEEMVLGDDGDESEEEMEVEGSDEEDDEDGDEEDGEEEEEEDDDNIKVSHWMIMCFKVGMPFTTVCVSEPEGNCVWT